MKLSQQQSSANSMWNNLLGPMSRVIGEGKGIQHPPAQGRIPRRINKAAGALTLLAVVLGVTLASRSAQQVAVPAGPVPNATSLNGPGDVFLTANLFSSGGTATSFVAVADFNGDGKLDYVTANPGNNTIAVALGNGDGTFKTPTSTGVACNPASVAIGDFNGDGKLDLALSARGCNPGTNGVTILLGNGDGTFTAKGTLTTPLANPFSAVVGDFNGDGKMDLAVVDHGSSTDSVFFFLGKGDGTFQAPTSVDLGANVGSNQIVAADFNKDGHLDVAVSHTGVSSSLFVILGNGDGTFQAPRSVVLPTTGWGVAVGDFNGDGIPDLVATTPADAGICVFLGKGDGNFTPVNNPVSGNLPTTNAGVPGQGASTSVAVGDFNGDGKQDVIVALGGLSSVSVLLGNGDGTLGPQSLFATAPYVNVSSGANAVAVGDFNGDGKLDWVAATSSALDSATVALGRGDGTFQSARVYTGDNAPQWLALADFNGDGILDMVVPNQPANDVSILMGNSDGTFQAPVNMPFSGFPGVVVTGDFNNDGKQDLAVRNGFGNPTTVAIFLGNGDGTFQAPKSFSTGGTGGSYIVAGDFNGDGKLDLAVSNHDGVANADIAILLGNGDGTFGAPIITPTGAGSIQWFTAADLNKDGHLDLIVTDNTNGNVAIFLGKGDGTFQPPTTLARQFANVPAVGDFNNDGIPDLVVTAANGAFVYLGRGDGTFNAPLAVNLGSPPPSGPTWVAVADFNLDGNLDFVVGEAPLRGVNNGYQGVQLLLGNGDGTFQPVQDYLAGAGNVLLQPAIGDFNRDGAPDVALLDLQNSIVVLLNQTPPPVNVSPKGLTFGKQIVGTTSSMQPVTVTNNGTRAATVTVAVSGDFAETNTCPVSPATLAAAASCTISVTFTPTTTGPLSGSVTVTDTLPGSPQIVALSGTGVAPVVTLGGNSISFGDQIVGMSSAVQMVTLSNTGTATLSISSITITGTNSGDFSQTNTCGASVAAGANCSISVTFKPTATGSRAASVTITDNASGSPQTVSLTGTGTAPIVSFGTTTNLDFGNQLVGATSTAQTVTLTNTGTSTLTFSGSGITITGTNSGDFSQTNTCGASVAAGANCTISITFKPTATGARNASLSVTDDAAGSPQSISLTGTGVIPAVTLSGSSLTFAGQLITTTSSAQSVTLTNSGTAPLTISSIAITGTNSGDFAQTNTCPASSATLAASANCSISVTFTPTVTGGRTASVTITDNASGSPHSISLSGTGTDFSLDAATGSNCPSGGNCSTSATISAGGTATYNLQVTPNSGFNSAVALACSGAPGASTCTVSPASVPAPGSMSYAFTVTVGNTANVMLVPQTPFRHIPGRPNGYAFMALPILLFVLCAARPGVTHRYARRALIPAMGVLFVCVLSIAGCGGGGGGPTVPPPTNAVLKVTGTSGGVNRTVNLNLTVNH